MADLFTITFEDGTTNEFDSTVGAGLAAIAPGLVATAWCMEVDITDVNARYGQIATAGDEDQVRLFLSLDPLTIDPLVMAGGDVFTTLLVQDNAANDAFRIELGYAAATGFRVRPGVYTDGGAWTNGGWVNISANEHIVELEWSRATGFGMNDGSIEMWVDIYETDLFGAAHSSVAGVDNDIRVARVYRLGAPAGLDAGTSGILWVDHLAANDDGTPIGHPGTLAFPTAEGAGRYSVGGRGGTVYKITNLNDAGAGSLREALEAAGPRIVVFEIDGTIELAGNITIDDPYISIYGQTAPGDGICLRNYTLRIHTHDVIIQHIRSRPGDTSGTPPGDLDGFDIVNDPVGNTDADDMAFNVILDHCSASWASDENIAVWNSAPANSWIKNITVQWCIISEGLHDPEESRASMGMLFGADGDVLGVKNVSVHHNLFVHNRIRNPRLSEASEFEVLNNVMHDCVYVAQAREVDANFNYIGNTVVSQSANYTLLIEHSVGTDDPADYHDYQIYVDDNTGNYYVLDDWEIVGKGLGAAQGAGAAAFRNAWESAVLIYIANSQLVAELRADAYANTLAMAGCFPRDLIDARIVQEVADGVERIIDSQFDVGGWPVLTPGVAGADSDGDGMPDEWEIERGLDPNVPDDTGYDLSDIWTNIEIYASGGGGVVPPERIRRVIVSMMI